MGLIVKIGANLSAFDKEMKKLTKDVNTVGDKLKGAGTKLTTGITLPIVGIATAATLTGMSFESAMSKVAAISGATGSDLEALEKVAREMGAATQFSATESAEALQYMALAGWDTEQMISALPGVLDLAAAGTLDLATASDIVTDMMSMYGMSAEDASRASDVFAKAQATSNTNVEQLAEALKYAGATSNAAGMDLEQTSAILGVLADNGLKGSSAGTALDAMFRDIKKSAKDGKIAIGDTAVEVYDANGAMRSMADIMADVEKASAGMNDETRDAALSSVFQSQALRGVNILLGAGTDAIYELEEGLYDSNGAAKEMAATMNDNLSGRLKEMKSALEEVGITIYQNLQPALEVIVGAIKSLADWFTNLSPTTQNLIMGLAALAAAIGPLLLAIGTGIILFGKLKAALAILKVSFMAVTWPILAVIAALAAIVAVVVYWEEIKTFFINLWETLKVVFSSALEAIKAKCTEIFSSISEYLSGVWESISETISTAWNAVKDFFAQIWNSIWSTIEPIVTGIANFLKATWDIISGVTSSVWNFIKQYLVAIWDALVLLLKPVFDRISNIISTVWNTIKTVSSKVWNTIQSALSAVWNVIKSLVSSYFNAYMNYIKSIWDKVKSISSTVWNAIKNTVSSIWDSMKSKASTIFNALKSTIETPVNYIKDKVSAAFNGMKSTALGAWEGLKSGMKTVINGIIRLVNKFINGFNTPAKLLNKLPGVSAPIIPDIPMLATGGSVSGSGAFISGEAGPELVQKSGSSVKVTPLSSQERSGGIGGAIGGGSNQPIHLYLNVDGETVAEKVIDSLDMLQGQKQSMKNYLGGY